MERLTFGPKPGRPGGSGGKNYMKGMKEFMIALNVEVTAIKGRTMKGLIMATAHIRDQTESGYPLTPVDLGNLRSSWFVTTAQKKEPNDKWNKGFRSTRRGTTKIKDATLASNHINTIKQAQQEIALMDTPDKRFLMMGYSVNYSGFVHEFVGDVNFKRQDSDAKWLQTHLYNNKAKILQIIRDNAQIKS
jgi:hypothetical protein